MDQNLKTPRQNEPMNETRIVFDIVSYVILLSLFGFFLTPIFFLAPFFGIMMFYIVPILLIILGANFGVLHVVKKTSIPMERVKNISIKSAMLIFLFDIFLSFVPIVYNFFVAVSSSNVGVNFLDSLKTLNLSIFSLVFNAIVVYISVLYFLKKSVAKKS